MPSEAGHAGLRITEEQVGDVTVLRLAGRLILEEGDVPLRDRVNDLVERGRVRIVIDMRGVTRLDSAGIGMLAAKLVTALRRGGTIKLLHLTERSDQLLGVTRLSTVFDIYVSEAEAIRSFETASYPPFFRRPSSASRSGH